MLKAALLLHVHATFIWTWKYGISSRNSSSLDTTLRVMVNWSRAVTINETLVFFLFAEGEQEAAWLKDAGFPHLATKFEGTAISLSISLWVRDYRVSVLPIVRYEYRSVFAAETELFLEGSLRVCVTLNVPRHDYVIAQNVEVEIQMREVPCHEMIW